MLNKIISFGYIHGNPQPGPGKAIVDIRKLFRNPHTVWYLKTRTGKDPQVQNFIKDSPNFDSLYSYIKEQITTPGVHNAYIGCYGGRHRSVFIAEKLGQELNVPVEHRDL